MSLHRTVGAVTGPKSKGEPCMRKILPLLFVVLLQLLRPCLVRPAGIPVAEEPVAAVPVAVAKVRPKIALVLAGGSAYGIAHVGVIKVLEELGVPVDIVVGTSMGSVIGGFYALGYDAQELEDIITAADWMYLADEDTISDTESFMYMTDRSRYAAAVHFDKKGFTIGTGYLTGHKMLRFADSITLSVPSPVDFDDLPRKFRAVATDISNGERIVLSSGSISEAMRGSSSVPGAFAPYFLDGRYLVDGCLVDNLPIDLARSMGADIIIAVDLFDGMPFDPDTDTRSPISFLTRSFDILVNANVQRQLERADLVIPVDLSGFSASDFDKAGEIMDVGETSARKRTKELTAITVFSKQYPEYEEDLPKRVASSPPVGRILVEGASKKRSDQIKKLFEPLVGTVPDFMAIQELYLKIDKSGYKETIRIRRDFVNSDRPLVITLGKKKLDANMVRVNFSYESSFSNVLISDLDLVPALSYSGLTTIDSRLLIDVELIDASGFDVRFIQPLHRLLYVSPFLGYSYEFNTRLSEDTVPFQFRTLSRTFGVRLVLQPGYGYEWSLGWSSDRIDDLDHQELSWDAYDEPLSIVHAGFEVHRVDSPIFPVKGILASVEGVLSRPEMGSPRSFATIETRGSTFFSFNKTVSAAFLWKAGTVISADSEESLSIPTYYKPDLSGRRMFPAPLDIDERIGDHAAGTGFELKYNMNPEASGIRFPVFLLMHAAAGVCVDNLQDVDAVSRLFHWNATVGIGIKISDAFGAAFRGGILQRGDKSFIPFIALDIGSIAYK